MRTVVSLGLAWALSLGYPAHSLGAPPPGPSSAPSRSPAAPGPVLTPGPVVTPADPWAEAMAAFATADTRDTQSGGVVFVGSSSIRLWADLEKRYRSYAAINRGFGGSTLADCVKHMDRLVLPHKPRLVIIYAGDNDLAGGRTAEKVLIDFVELSSRIQERLPKTQIVFVSIKPSPARVDLLDRIREANTRIRNYVATKPYLQYIDVFTPMLDAQGKPRGELFGSDALHLNEEGYALWHALISPVLPLDEQPAVLREGTNVPAKPAAAPARPKPIDKPRPDPPVAKAASTAPSASPSETTDLARTPGSPDSVKIELQPALPPPSAPPAQRAAASSSEWPSPGNELATAPPSPPRVKTDVQPAAPPPAPVETLEPAQQPAPAQTSEVRPTAVPMPAGTATEADRGPDATSGGSKVGGTGGSAAGVSDQTAEGRRD